ncbi:hypothetical protein DL95DRAFT_390336, partial [Leptodontidium sp. 2 PMI_412]
MPLVIQSVERILEVFNEGKGYSSWLSDDSIQEAIRTFNVPPSIHIFGAGWGSTYKADARQLKCFTNKSIREWILTFGHDCHFTTAHIDKLSRIVTYYDSMAAIPVVPSRLKRQVADLLDQHSMGDSWVHIPGTCQQQVDFHNCGIFTLHNIECILQGYDPKSFTVEPKMLRYKYARAISKMQHNTDHQEIFERMLS